MRRAFVWIRCADGSIRPAGELGVTDPAPNTGRFKTEFEYARQWTVDNGDFPLDPVSLPLNTASRRFNAELFYPPLGVFDDALPDDWGRSLLAAALKQEGRKPTALEMLLRMRGGGTGALIFTETPAVPRLLDTIKSTALPTLLHAAEQYERGTLPPDDEFRKLLEGSSRAGGARPKALVHEGTDEWLAKFPSLTRDGAYDVVGLEATCLTLARRAGLDVPDHSLRKVGARRVLMVRRFDVTAQNGRLHMVSLRTLCRKRPGIYVHGYSDLAQMVRQHSVHPLEDVAMLFRHMVFNAAIGNVDDHLKNFWMLGQSSGYRLAPAFDLVPDITGRAQHTLQFMHSSHCPSRTDLMQLAHDWNVRSAAEIVDQVAGAVNAFAATASDLRVRGGESLEGVCRDVNRRVQIMTA